MTNRAVVVNIRKRGEPRRRLRRGVVEDVHH
jgi:hypothetical protein